MNLRSNLNWSLEPNPLGEGRNMKPEWIADWLMDRFFQPGRKPLKEKAQIIAEQARQESLIYRGHQIRTYYWHNEGPLVYLAHGWGGRAMSFYAVIEALVEQGYAVFTFDGVAHGESDGKSSSFIEFVDLNNFVLSQTHKPNFAVGHSMGGAALINAFTEMDYDVPLALVAPMYSIAKVLENIQKRRRIPKVLMDSIIRHIETRFNRYVESLETIDKVPNLRSRSVVFHDPADEMTYIKNSQKLVDAWPNSELVKVEGPGHSRILRDKQVIEQILDFFEEHKN